MTPRKAAVLALQLPAGAQVWVSAGIDAAWTPAEHLAAREVDLLAGANWQRSGGKGARPDLVLRPSQRAEERTRIEQMRHRALRFKAKQEGGGS